MSAPATDAEWRAEFDRYRAAYDGMTWADKRAYNEWLYDYFPNQAAATTVEVGLFVARVAIHVDQPRVVEVGGWRGALARRVLASGVEVGSWTNVEMTRKAVQATVCTDERYRVVEQEWPLEEMVLPEGDAVVVAHVIEHLKARELRPFLAALGRYAWLYLEAPIGHDTVGETWAGYGGTHVLEVGWMQVREMLGEAWDVVAAGGAPYGWMILRRRAEP